MLTYSWATQGRGRAASFTTAARSRRWDSPRRVAALGMVLAVLALGGVARAATITVTSLADPGASGVCVLPAAITAANTKTATNGCMAGTGKDMIRFSLTGTIHLASTLPQVTDRQLTITGPASPGITIDGGNKVQVMQVAIGATVTLSNLTLADSGNHFSFDIGGGIDNNGTLTVINSTFSGNSAGDLALQLHFI